MSVSQIPLKIDELQEDVYGDFASRFCAQLLDLLFLAPLGLLYYLTKSVGKDFHIGVVLLNFVIIAWYQIYLVKKNGGTPGKLLSGIKIIKLNGQAVGWKEAFLRHSIDLTLSLAYNIAIIYTLTKADDAHYSNLSWLRQTAYLVSFYPLFFRVDSWFRNIWTWSELIILLTNKRKRALHDFIAGTLVVKIKYMADIDEIVNHSEEGTIPIAE